MFHRFAPFALLGLLLALPAAALDRGLYSVELLLDGLPAAEHAARGRHYIEAIEGREYSIRLTNRSGERVAIALSVDGLNVIDAKSSRPHQASKWILGPHDSLTLNGWQTDRSTARRFFFTTEQESYGSWLGNTNDLGIISAAIFREKRPRPRPIAPGIHEKRSRVRPEEGSGRSLPEADAEGLSDELAATGIGREVNHRVQRVRFDAQASPAALIELRYEYRDALVRLGVLPDPIATYEQRLSRREAARGFQFAPDPFARQR